jgi:hypothetical protein
VTLERQFMRYGVFDSGIPVGRWRQAFWLCGRLAPLAALAGVMILMLVKQAEPAPIPACRPIHVSAVSRIIFVQIEPGGHPPAAPFFLSKFAVTQAQWRQVTGVNPPGFTADDLPVENVPADDCRKFCDQLCKLEKVPGETYRLPTPTELASACRAGEVDPANAKNTVGFRVVYVPPQSKETGSPPHGQTDQADPLIPRRR